jgi:hypothetical protein
MAIASKLIDNAVIINITISETAITLFARVRCKAIPVDSWMLPRDTFPLIHGQKSGTNITPGQAFTDEWGIGQVLPIKKDMSMLAQLGVVGYDQWQVSHSSGTLVLSPGPPPIGIPESSIPFYSVHAIGVQANFILPAKNVTTFFKYYDEYRALARPQGRTFVFGFSWTLRIPKPVPPAAAQPPQTAKP